jgi:hypothetical protein
MKAVFLTLATIALFCSSVGYADSRGSEQDELPGYCISGLEKVGDHFVQTRFEVNALATGNIGTHHSIRRPFHGGEVYVEMFPELGFVAQALQSGYLHYEVHRVPIQEGRTVTMLADVRVNVPASELNHLRSEMTVTDIRPVAEHRILPSEMRESEGRREYLFPLDAESTYALDHALRQAWFVTVSVDVNIPDGHGTGRPMLVSARIYLSMEGRSEIYAQMRQQAVALLEVLRQGKCRPVPSGMFSETLH